MVMFGGVECYECGKFVELENATSKTVEVETGRSGGSLTIRGGSSSGNWGKKQTSRRSSGASYNMGRKYYKNITVHVCDECNRKKQEEAAQMATATVVMVIAGLLIWGAVTVYNWFDVHIPIWKEYVFGPPQITAEEKLKQELVTQQQIIEELKAKTELIAKEAVQKELAHKQELINLAKEQQAKELETVQESDKNQ